jgi:hypothetical protein
MPSVPGPGTKFTEHDADGPLPESMQELNGWKVPGLVLLQKTFPVGVMGVPGDVSCTVAVQCVGLLTGTEPGTQLTSVMVERWVTCKLKVAELPE